MPTYAFACKKCGNQFEVFQAMSADKPKSCPSCKARKPNFGQTYDKLDVTVRAYGYENIKTVGQQAEWNDKQMGKEMKEIKIIEEQMKRKSDYTGPIPEGGQIPAKKKGIIGANGKPIKSSEIDYILKQGGKNE